MTSEPPVSVVGLFPEERARLVELLRDLSPDHWHAPTSCPGWSVKDIVAHVIGDDLNNLSGGRDGFRDARFEWERWDELVAYINKCNEMWVEAMRRLSPEVLLDLLSFSGERARLYYQSLDLWAPGPNVAWAGAGEHPMWLHLAREYTERWLHQAQVREALGAPMLHERRLLHPVLDTFARALPVAYASIEAPAGAGVAVVVTGDAGGRWVVRRGPQEWRLDGSNPEVDATVTLDQSLAWRLWTKGMDAEAARPRVRGEGPAKLCEPVLYMVSIIA
jgi:uncharacterized protein (TIGR03083 family)